jgi:tetratricopeptide (TPR) repeat protein
MTQRQNLTLDEILSIPGNRLVFEALTLALRKGEAIAFVGAGASAGIYPLWGEFIERLVDHAVAAGKVEPKDAARWKADTISTPQQRVSVITRKLGERSYRVFLKETFAPRTGADGRRYTPTHAALLRLPFRGYVTTNYDAALEFARMELRPGGLTTGTPTWQDDDEVHRWYTGDVFKREEDCPILWLHGHWQRPDGIVLSGAEYFAAYKPGLYRRLFEALWGQRRLVFVGFGFNDPQFTFMVGEYLRDIENTNALPRHFAIVSLAADESYAPPDTTAVREWRDNLEEDYHIRPLFYPVHGGDHSALQVLLDAIAAECGAVNAHAATPVSPALASPGAFTAKWFHEPTNDDKFVGRDDEIERLDRWVRDDAVRVIGISAVGGTGKTALVGRWLRNTDGWYSRPFEGLFAWSFYQNRDPDNFLRELLLWAHEALDTPRPDEMMEPVSVALALTRAHPLVIVLDGLEVLQEGTEDARHGLFLDAKLQKFLATLCQREHRCLAVLTSRFVFADLYRFLGTNFHQLELRGLAPEHGARLLEELNVGGPTAERVYVSESLYGHPLGLRVFAGALPDEDLDQPRRFADFAFRADEIPMGAPLNDKLRRLLIFYEEKLPALQRRLLSVVALFRIPVADDTVARLARELFIDGGKQKPPDDTQLTAALQRLQARGILSREPIEGGYGSACHPILRDHFRAVLLRGGATTARRTADLLKGQHSDDKPQSVKEIEQVLLAIEILLYAGAFAAAHDLYQSRLANGDVFLTIPAPTEGLACALGFVRDEARQKQCRNNLSLKALAFYLNEVGRHGMQSGYFEFALSFYDSAIAVARGTRDAPNMSLGLLNKSELLALLGRLADARLAASEAIELARQQHDWKTISHSHSIRGWGVTLSGHLQSAAEDLARADKIKKKFSLDLNELESLVGIHGAELLVRCNHSVAASRRALACLSVCRQKGWNYNVALCHWMLAWCALAGGQLDVAEAELRQAEPIFYRSHLLFDLARLHVTAGEIDLSRRDTAGALHRASEALSLAAPRGMRLVHADALVLRGRARLLGGQSDGALRALDDAEEALRLANECGYAWAGRDALFLAAEAHAARAAQLQVGDSALAADREREAAHRARQDAKAFSDKLVLKRRDLTAANKRAAEWLEDLSIEALSATGLWKYLRNLGG